MRTFAVILLASAFLEACAGAPPNAVTAPPPILAVACAHDGPPPVLRRDLPVTFVKTPGQILWPPNNGFAPATLPVVIQPGALIDRYGDGAGRFFSPKGTGYADRALPYVCRGYVYHTYRVMQPLQATVGTATPWFGEPGGAVQVMTDRCVDQLVTAGVIEVVPDSPPPACPAS